ncbi:MAG: CehA/McbA family metallohydrolase [Myxococcota bacterium]
MSLRRVFTGSAALLIAAGLGWYLVGGGQRPGAARPPKLPFRAQGITISAVPAGGLTSGGNRAEGAAGDLLVQNGRLAFVIGGDAPGLERQVRHGALLDLAVKDFRADELLDLRAVVRVAGKPLPLLMGAVTLVRDGKFPVVRVEQVSGDGRVQVATDFEAAPNASKIELVTRLHNAGDQVLRTVELGERTRWPGAGTFSPRVGFPKLTSKSDVSWLGREGAQLSYGLVFPRGAVTSSFIFDIVGQVGQETTARVGDVAAGASIAYRRELFVVPGDMSDLAEAVLLSLGTEIGWVIGRIEPPPAWAHVDARFPDGKPALSVRARKDGSFRLPLPVGDYGLDLRAPGGEDDSQVSVFPNQKTEVRFSAKVPGHLRYQITDGDGAELSARLVLRGVSPTKDPDLFPVEQASGARNVVYTRSGSGDVELPAGHYSVVVSHGPEYEIATHDIEVDSQNGAAIHASLARSVDTRGWLGCDFHVHSAPSRDSSVSLPDRVLSLLAEGVEFAVPTDHNHITDYAKAIAEHRAISEIGSTPGVEITTGTWGHFNAYPYPAHAAPPPFSGVNPIEIFAAVHARAPQAVIQVNHPRMPGVGYFNRIELNAETGAAATEGASFEFDAIEVVNGYDLENPKFIENNIREYFALLNFGRRYTATGNSDSHRLIINWAGYPRTYVRVPDDQPGNVSAVDVARAVNDGHAIVANGIFLVVSANGHAGPGDTLVGPRVTLEMEARAPSWVDLSRVEVWVNGGLFSTSPTMAKPVPGGRLVWQVELDLRLDSWIVVVAQGNEPMTPVFYGRRVLPFAFTNPIFVDADENGVFRAPEAPEPSTH